MQEEQAHKEIKNKFKKIAVKQEDSTLHVGYWLVEHFTVFRLLSGRKKIQKQLIRKELHYGDTKWETPVPERTLKVKQLGPRFAL